MILPAVRERLEALLRHPSVEGVVGEVRAGSNLVGLSGLQDVAKLLVATHVVHELRRPAFFLTKDNRRAEDLADSLRFFAQIFPAQPVESACSPRSTISHGIPKLLTQTSWNIEPLLCTAWPMGKSPWSLPLRRRPCGVTRTLTCI